MSERSLTVAIDCDDVLVPTAHDAVLYYNTTYATSVDISRYYDGSAEDWGAEDLQVVNQRLESYHKEVFFNKPPMPSPEAIISIKSLASVHKLHLVTGRADFLAPVTEVMVSTYFLDCFQEVIHTNHFRAECSRSKGQVCKEIGADILIDDGLMHCESAIEEGVEMALLLDQPWNRKDKLHHRIKRCGDWGIILKEIEHFAGC